jgi:D-alanine--poly(phosphoribitol) ligase subunit 2
VTHSTPTSAWIIRLTKIFSERLLLRIESPDTDLLDSGILDSMKLVELLFTIEQEFGIRLPIADLDIESFRSVSRLAGLVDRFNVMSEVPTAT